MTAIQAEANRRTTNSGSSSLTAPLRWAVIADARRRQAWRRKRNLVVIAVVLTAVLGGVVAFRSSGGISGAGSPPHPRISGRVNFCTGLLGPALPPIRPSTERCVTFPVSLTLLGPNRDVAGVTRSRGGTFSFAVAPGRYMLVARDADGRVIGRATWNAVAEKMRRVKIRDNSIE